MQTRVAGCKKEKKKRFQITSVIFILEPQVLDWKQGFQIENASFRLKTQFFNWKGNF